MQFLTQCFSQSVRPPSFEDSRLRPLSAQRWTSTTLPLGDGYELELVLDGDVFDRLYELQPQETREAVEDPDVMLLRGAIPYVYGLWIVDDTAVGIVVYTEKGIQGCILNDTETAVGWGLSS